MEQDLKGIFDELSNLHDEYINARQAFFDKMALIEKNMRCPACGGRVTFQGNPIREGNIHCSNCGLDTGKCSYSNIGNHWISLVEVFTRKEKKQKNG